ncbi:MAG TPA: alpha/beta fold hydrolase [Silvibacterium sp.]|nr:alpha/beta fold hydrolase [Silvibacterium sp.]
MVHIAPIIQNAPSRNRGAIRLFCVPHAGAGPSAFRGWKEQLGPEIEAIIIQLPGREGRFREEPYQNLERLVRDLAEAVVSCLDTGQRFAFFGNSLGGLIAFESLHEIRRRTGYEAVHLFVSATGAPHLPPVLPPMGHLSNRELIREVSERYGGIPLPILEDDEFLEAVVPALRADIRMLEAYDRTMPQRLSCPITAFGGRHDRTVPLPHLEGWREQTTSSFTKMLLDEEHLYLQSAREQLTGFIRETLLASACLR